MPLQEDGFMPVDHKLRYTALKECLKNIDLLKDERGGKESAFGSLRMTPGYKFHWKVNRVLYQKQTPYQYLEVMDLEDFGRPWY